MSWNARGKTAVVGIGFSKLLRNSSETIGKLALDACNIRSAFSAAFTCFKNTHLRAL